MENDKHPIVKVDGSPPPWDYPFLFATMDFNDALDWSIIIAMDRVNKHVNRTIEKIKQSQLFNTGLNDGFLIFNSTPLIEGETLIERIERIDAIYDIVMFQIEKEILKQRIKMSEILLTPPNSMTNL